MLKNLVLEKYPKILTGVKPRILIQCRPKFFTLLKNPEILTSQVGHEFLVSKNIVLIKNPKILTGVTPKILKNFNRKSLYSLKTPEILNRQTGHGFSSVQNLGCMKKPKILTGVKLWIFDIMYVQNLCALQIRQDFDKPYRQWSFGV